MRFVIVNWTLIARSVSTSFYTRMVSARSGRVVWNSRARELLRDVSEGGWVQLGVGVAALAGLMRSRACVIWVQARPASRAIRPLAIRGCRGRGR